jgi:hypothetical protein
VSDPNRPGDVPPDLPPQYAEAYRRGYERAYRQAGNESKDDTDQASSTTEERPLFVDEIGRPTTLPSRGGAHRAERADAKPAPNPLDDHLFPDTEPAEPDEPRDRPAWLVPVLLAGLIVVLLIGAYGIGRVLSDNLSGAQVAPEKPDGVVINEDGSTSTPESPSPQPSKKPQAKKYAGQTGSATIGGASATCESPNGVDSAGNAVPYTPGNVYDQDLTTAWRCDGDGTGQKLTIDLADTTRIGEVGLTPGYAKTDAHSGVDRYAENNRITKVRWTFDDGTSVEQDFDPSPTNRSMQSIRIPVTKASRVVVEIVDAKRGARNTVAVSELRIGQTAN